MHAEKKIPIFLSNTLLLHIPLLALTDGQNDRQRDEYTRCVWAGGTFFPVVVLLCQFFGFWQEIGFDVTYLYIVQYSCGVVLVFLVLAGNSFWYYIRT